MKNFLVLALVTGIVLCQEHSQLCVRNDRNDVVKAFWRYEEERFDQIHATTKICYTVARGIRYIFTTWNGLLLKVVTVDQPKVDVNLSNDDPILSPNVLKGVVQAKDQQADFSKCGHPKEGCYGNGYCVDRGVPWTTCRCHDDAEKGHWSPPFCAGCADRWVGERCDKYCYPNGLLEDGEECDDGNEIAGDGCTDCAFDVAGAGNALRAGSRVAHIMYLSTIILVGAFALIVIVAKTCCRSRRKAIARTAFL